MATSEHQEVISPARYEWPVLEVCQRINAADKGTGDPLSDRTLEVYWMWLRDRVENWENSFERSLGYDFAVKLLAEQAMAIAWRLRNGDK